MSGYLPEELYKTVTDNVPIICVDIIPVRKHEKYEVGMIVRATGTQAGKWTILGGRINHSESIGQAISRHLKTDLGIDEFTYFGFCAEGKPFLVQQYFMTDGPDGSENGFDPTKHALALTYLVEIKESEIKPENEASDFVWVGEPITDSSKTGFNQHIVINKALEELN